MTRITVFFVLLITLTACRATTDSAISAQTAVPAEAATFSEQQAIDIVLKSRPEYPQAGQTRAIETMTGGPAPGTKVTGTMTTEIEPAPDPQTYIVTLTKQWNLNVNGEELIGKWIYNVTPEGAQMLSSEDNTELVQFVK